MDNNNNGVVYSIYDRLSNALGVLVIMRAPAAAIRFFSDVATHPESQLHKHVEDYELWQLGYIDKDNNLVPQRETIMTGAAWKAAQQTSAGPTSPETGTNW